MSEKENMPKPFFSEDPFGWWPTKFSSLWDEVAKRTPGFGSSDVALAEDEHNLYVEAKMPGLDVNDIEVTLENGTLWIRGERKEEKKEKKKYYQKSFYSYSYRLSIPNYVEETNPEANYTDGVMTITFKKLPKEKKGQKIEVKKT